MPIYVLSIEIQSDRNRLSIECQSTTNCCCHLIPNLIPICNQLNGSQSSYQLNCNRKQSDSQLNTNGLPIKYQLTPNLMKINTQTVTIYSQSDTNGLPIECQSTTNPFPIDSQLNPNYIPIWIPIDNARRCFPQNLL